MYGSTERLCRNLRQEEVVICCNSHQTLGSSTHCSDLSQRNLLQVCSVLESSTSHQQGGWFARVVHDVPPESEGGLAQGGGT
jgi:hypothetical protein